MTQWQHFLATCFVPAHCGDGVRYLPVEQEEDGDTLPSDSLSHLQLWHETLLGRPQQHPWLPAASSKDRAAGPAVLVDHRTVSGFWWEGGRCPLSAQDWAQQKHMLMGAEHGGWSAGLSLVTHSSSDKGFC